MILLACVAPARGGACSPKTSFSAVSAAAVEGWAANATAASYDDKRVALLMALHPPKFGEALAFLRSSRIAKASDEADVYMLFSSEGDRAGFEKRAPSGAWRRSLVLRKDPRYDFLWKSSGDYPVAKKHAGLAQLLDDVIFLRAPRPYRYAVLIDAETTWARPAQGFAAAVAAKARRPVFYGSDASEAHVGQTWHFFSSCLDKPQRAEALGRLRGGSKGAQPFNLWWTDLPYYDLQTLPKYMAFLRARSAYLPAVKKVFEYDLYVSWRVAIEKSGVVYDIAAARRRLGRGSWMEHAPDRAALQNIVKTQAMYVPYYDFSPKWRCELPASVYLLFHRDRNTEAHRFECCSRDWLERVPSGRVPCGGMTKLKRGN